MILKEFALISNQEKTKRFQFELQTRCITSLFERYFPEFETEDVWKILIYCTDIVPDSSVSKAVGVMNVFLKTDVDHFFSLTNEEKKEYSLMNLEKGIETVLNHTGWSSEPFLTALHKLKDAGLTNSWVWKKLSSPSRKLVAEVLVEHDVEECVISLVISDQLQNTLRSQIAVKELPDEWFFKKYLGKLLWESNQSVILLDAFGAKVCQVSV